jgi:hypothetical protein
VKIRTVVLFFWAGLIATAAIAGEKRETHTEIVTDDGGGEKIELMEFAGEGDLDMDIEKTN